MERQLGHIYVGAYKGPVTERGAVQYSREWMDTALGSVDELLYQQLELSRSQRRNKATILDLGCTRQATFFTDLLNDPGVGLNTRRFLQQNPSFGLDLVGLTDATTQEEFGKVVNQVDISNPEMRGSMRVFAYSFTAWQTLEKFIAEHQIETPNLIFATWSLAYISSNIFREILNTSVSCLTPGGRFIGSGYSESVAAMGFGLDYNQYPNLVYFNVQDKDIPKEVWPYLIGDSKLYETPKVTTQQLRRIKQLMTRFVKPLSEQQLLSVDQRDYVFSEIRRVRSLRRLSLAGSILRDPIIQLWNNKFQNVIKPKKDNVIRELMESKTDCIVEADFVKNIVIQKR